MQGRPSAEKGGTGMVDTKIMLCGMQLDNPIIPASGTFGFGKEYADLYDLNILGSIAIKGTTEQARYGNEQPRIAECTAGLINSIGLQNPGVNAVISNELPDLAKVYDKKVIANIGGFSVEDYENVASAFDFSDKVGILEVNISCPNVHEGGKTFGQDTEMAAKVTRAVKSVADTPVFVKLSPNVTDIVEIAEACVDAGADGLSLVNTFLGTRIDIRTRDFVIANKLGGFSGPAIFPIALRMVYEVSKAVDVPVIGIGGVDSAEKVIEMMMAGASAVQIGAANLVDPFICKTIIEELPELMQELGIERLEDIIGVAG
jgi:dihydroorotate dehydrogenase (NAD+) catalytic subunit